MENLSQAMEKLLMLKADKQMNYRGAIIAYNPNNRQFEWQHNSYVDMSFDSDGIESSTGFGTCHSVEYCMYEIDELLDK